MLAINKFDSSCGESYTDFRYFWRIHASNRGGSNLNKGDRNAGTIFINVYNITF
jgi:hypothetical protein